MVCDVGGDGAANQLPHPTCRLCAVLPQRRLPGGHYAQRDLPRRRPVYRDSVAGAGVLGDLATARLVGTQCGVWIKGRQCINTAFIHQNR